MADNGMHYDQAIAPRGGSLNEKVVWQASMPLLAVRIAQLPAMGDDIPDGQPGSRLEHDPELVHSRLDHVLLVDLHTRSQCQHP